jgi:hypothetical protein
MRPIFAAAILAIVLVGASLVVAGRLPAQVTHTFSNVIELGDGRVAAADATLIDDSTVSFMLMAPGLDLEWVEIRDREPGGTLLATTRSTGNGRAPHLQLIGMGEVLNEPDGAGVTIGLEDFLVELTLHAPGGGLGRTAEAGVVVVGFTDGQSTSFPILSGDPADEAADGAMITMAPGDEADEVFGDEPGPPEVVRAPAVEGRSGAAVGRTDTPAPSEPAVTRPPAPAPAARTQPPPGPTRAPQVPGPVPAPGPGPVPGPGNVPGPGAGPGSQGPAAGAVAGSDWLASATALRGRNGERFEFRCPPGGGAGRGPFGTTVYADHSSVCTAAVHAGLVSFTSGGSVTIEIRAGQDFYAGSPGQGGVTSSAAGGWPGSFAFVR